LCSMYSFENMNDKIYHAFDQVNAELKEKNNIEEIKSGTTAIITLMGLNNDCLVIANLGMMRLIPLTILFSRRLPRRHLPQRTFPCSLQRPLDCKHIRKRKSQQRRRNYRGGFIRYHLYFSCDALMHQVHSESIH
jgi:hypothetical protein